ncbi:MAG TPA: hypothetical protein VIW45_17975 [Vicinamibacterales bacterium]
MKFAAAVAVAAIVCAAGAARAQSVRSGTAADVAPGPAQPSIRDIVTTIMGTVVPVDPSSVATAASAIPVGGAAVCYAINLSTVPIQIEMSANTILGDVGGPFAIEVLPGHASTLGFGRDTYVAPGKLYGNTEVWCRVKVIGAPTSAVRANITMYSESGMPVVVLDAR